MGLFVAIKRSISGDSLVLGFLRQAGDKALCVPHKWAVGHQPPDSMNCSQGNRSRECLKENLQETAFYLGWPKVRSRHDTVIVSIL